MRPMGRPRQHDKHLPPRMRKRGRSYYYRARGREIPLGPDLAKARQEWTRLENDCSVGDNFAAIVDRWLAEVVPLKAKRTQKDYARHAAVLVKVFGHMALEEIAPSHVRRYYDLRAKRSLVQANRERAVLSMLINWARAVGIMDGPNPVAGVHGRKERPRSVYVDDAAFGAVWNAAPPCVRDALDLARTTGQRPADVLRMALTDIRDGCLEVRQGKTGKALRIQIEGELAATIERIRAQIAARPVASVLLVQDERGQPLGYWRFVKLFQRARNAAGEAWQFRDLRAKAGTDMDDHRAAQRLLGHASITTTEGYLRSRRGERVRPGK